jgi:hypothetical protein
MRKRLIKHILRMNEETIPKKVPNMKLTDYIMQLLQAKTLPNSK